MATVLAASLLLSACTENGSPPSEGSATDLQLHRPPSGGTMVLIPAGRFTMGDAQGQPEEETPPHEVAVRSFYMDRFPVTQAMYESIAGVNPSKQPDPESPVERIQWVEAARFCNLCSQRDGLTPCYEETTWACDFAAEGYRLPTEAEWEYACRAGTTTRYFFGDDPAKLAGYAWCKPHSRGRTHPVRQKQPNPWGLHDMLGNVWEWCNDFYDEDYYAASPEQDPTGPAAGSKRVLRGGAWRVTPDKCTVAYRFSEFQVFTDACFGADSYGFRRVRAVDATPRAMPQLASAPASRPTAPQPAPVVVAEGEIDRGRLAGTIVFVSDRGGGLDIWTMHASGRDAKRLTQDAHADADPRWSPSGKRILYTSARGGFPELWMMNADGSASKRIAEGSQGTWSPDGESIVFIRDDQAWVRELATGAERRVTPPAWQRCGVPAWSPDGKRLAVASRHLGDIGIFVFEAGGTNYTQLSTEDPCCTPQWSRDGERMLFQTVNGHIHQLFTDGGDEEQVTFGADIQHDPRFSPDGSMIVFSRAPTEQGPWQLCIADLESDDLDFVQITTEGSNRQPDWHAGVRSAAP